MICLQANLRWKEEKKPSKPPWTHFGRLTSSQEALQAGPLGGVPEEGIVIIGGGSSEPVIALEDLPVGQDVEVGHSDTVDPDPVHV